MRKNAEKQVGVKGAVVRYAYAILAAMLAADTFTRLFTYGTAYRSGTMSLIGAFLSDTDGRLFLSVGLAAALFFLSLAAGKAAERILTALAALSGAAILVLLYRSLPLCWGIVSFKACFIALVVFLITQIAASICCVRCAYLLFTINHQTGE